MFSSISSLGFRTKSLSVFLLTVFVPPIFASFVGYFDGMSLFESRLGTVPRTGMSNSPRISLSLVIVVSKNS